MSKQDVLPLWATPERKLLLANILTEYLAIKGWIFDLITGEYYHPDYEARIWLLIDYWKADDREARGLEYRLESIALHSLGEPTKPLRGQFSAISKDIWQSSQPLYYIENMAISGVTLKPFVKVRLASSYMHLHVNLGDTLRGVSKNKKRKAIRYGKPLPQSIEETIISLVNKAVTDYLAH